ncbi:5-formyltetrahydrofolate cyclo-ligase [Actinomycetospora sp. TBRC 11914]|uniref:5-formyltetrahydrofolate cyclo-ligase n=1 Tax=Actinomycetospora sp. TBRC 11914 TaxID=2729387 RepID=UPI0028A1B213|nr:5-formyltetrahydrofolate cyclo-ligase [Actinomycetospora sp. TBRC 11914]
MLTRPKATLEVTIARHDADAGGSPELLAAKQELRERIWSTLTERGHARFPGARHRIPNVTGAEAAAERLRDTDVWRRARTLKCNPDAAQWPVRQRALEDGKTVYMAVPRLAGPDPFFLLDPDDLGDRTPRQASSIKGASAAGRTVAVADLEPVDLVVAGCVAVSPDGSRLGKGGGFSDLEFAVAAQAGLVAADTPVVTTVHEDQVVADGEIPTVDHDVHLDLIVTAERTITCSRAPRHPARVVWDELTEAKIAAIPLLAALRDDAGASR